VATDSVRAYVPGSPGACRQTAADLRRLSRGVGTAVAFLDRQVSLPRQSLNGATGRAYRDASSTLRTELEAVDTDVVALAADLDTYADVLAEAQEVMTTALQVAPPAGLRVSGLDIELPEDADAEQAQAFGLISGNIHDAHQQHYWALDLWEQSLAEHTGALTLPLPRIPPAQVPVWPIPDEAWPAPVPPDQPPPDPGPPQGREPGPDTSSPVDRPDRALIDPAPTDPAPPPTPPAPAPAPAPTEPIEPPRNEPAPTDRAPAHRHRADERDLRPLQAHPYQPGLIGVPR
jgi:hypothetical protein